MTGSIQSDSRHLRVWAHLILGDNGEQLWAKSFERNNTAADLFEIQNEIVTSILTAIGWILWRDFQGCDERSAYQPVKRIRNL